jgi:hypothetical protein
LHTAFEQGALSLACFKLQGNSQARERLLGQAQSPLTFYAGFYRLYVLQKEEALNAVLANDFATNS